MLSGMWHVVLSPRQKHSRWVRTFPPISLEEEMRSPGDEITFLTNAQLHTQRDWGSNFNCSASLKPWSFHYGRSLCSIELYLHAKSGTIQSPDISSMSELGLWRQERSKAGVRSAENPAPGTWLKTKHQPSKGENGLAGDSWKDVYQDNREEIKLNPVHSQGP